jgi:hypothetical protein
LTILEVGSMLRSMLHGGRDAVACYQACYLGCPEVFFYV